MPIERLAWWGYIQRCAKLLVKPFVFDALLETRQLSADVSIGTEVLTGIGVEELTTL